MGNTTAWVRAALDAKGWDAPEKEIKVYIQDNAPDIPRGQIGLALRKLRTHPSLVSSDNRLPAHGELFRK